MKRKCVSICYMHNCEVPSKPYYHITIVKSNAINTYVSFCELYTKEKFYMWDYFEQLLQQRNITVVEVSKATGIPQSTFSMWKNRRNILSAENLLKLSKFFNVPMEYFLGSDCIEWDPESQEIVKTDDYYVSDEAKQMAQFLFSNPEYRVLFDASRKVKPEDLQKAIKMLGVLSDCD